MQQPVQALPGAGIRKHDLPEAALIDMGDFAGGTLKYVRRHPVPRLTLAGGFAKLAKLAQGHLYLHSARSRLDHGALVAELARLGADAATLGKARSAASGGQILALARVAGLPLADAIAGRALDVARSIAGTETRLEVVVFTRAGEAVGHAG